MPSLGIIILCFNGSDNVTTVLEQISKSSISKKTIIKCIIIIDNFNKTNVEKHINKDIFPQTKFTIIKNDENYGIGGSQKIAFDEIFKYPIEYLSVFHSNLRTDYTILGDKYFTKMTQNKYDLFLMNRFHKFSNFNKYNSVRVFGNIFFNYLFKTFISKKIIDNGAALFLVKTKNLKELREEYLKLNNGTPFNVLLNVLLLNKNIKVTHIDIKWSESLTKSHLNIINHGYELLINIVKFFFTKKFICEKKKKFNYSKLFLN